MQIKYGLKILLSLIISFLFNQKRVSTRMKEKSDLKGPYQSWEEAKNNSTGYNSEIILEKTKSSLLKIKSGEAIYERDSVIFNEVHYSWPLLTGLMWAAGQSGGRLNVLDFGGSLGSTYYQNQKFLNPIHEVRWNIVEQLKHVKVGKEYFENDKLKFYLTMEECLNENNINVIILSSVLHYLEEPYIVLNKLVNTHSKCIIIDRTPFSNDSLDKLYVQKIPPEIFKASYPMWVFSLNKFKEFIKPVNIIAEFYGFENGLFGFEWKGFIIQNNYE